jgi:glycosyltransferase 2 family protein
MVFPVKALRWRVILAPVQQVKMRPLLSAIMIGFMANCIISRLGEIVRGVALSLRTPVRASMALSSIALERIFDSCVVLLFLVVALLWLPAPTSEAGADMLVTLRKGGAVLAVLFCAGVAFLIFLRFRPAVAQKMVKVCVSWLPKSVQNHVASFLNSFIEGLNSLRDARQVAALLVLSIVHWLIQVMYFLFIGYCFPALGLSPAGALLVFAVVALGVAAIPTPGYIGIYQGSIAAAAAILGLGSRSAEVTSYQWLAWAGNIPVIVLIGFTVMWTEGLSLKQLRGEAMRTEMTKPE